jgi:ATP-dependent protease HslVU (ClpYQ) ATPase subunit
MTINFTNTDLLAELQGRLPIRVTLKGLTEGDLYRILTEPVNNLIRQQVQFIITSIYIRGCVSRSTLVG